MDPSNDMYYTIAGVLAWANGWIYAKLSDPMDSIVALFSQDTVLGVSYAAAAVAYIITGQIVVHFGMYVVEKYATVKKPLRSIGYPSIRNPRKVPTKNWRQKRCERT
jgi:hypothetical protein